MRLLRGYIAAISVFIGEEILREVEDADASYTRSHIRGHSPTWAPSVLEEALEMIIVPIGSESNRLSLEPK